ncbi:hypothetical protein [Staphylococcus epidermidis]|uniref:hypothetical protein n=1 Tax=Staphylococcus epidermidis TaxID=1282 RepID=UPI001EEED7DC|nr:hypothetical protein [Staphylococcus epidermidis]
MKKFLFLLIICLVTFATCFSPITHAKESKPSDNKILNKNDVEKVNLNQVQNLDVTLENHNLTRENLLNNNYKVKKDNVGFINAKDKNNVYYNFYLEGNKIEYYSIQKKLANGNSTFTLYDINGNYILKSEANNNGDIVKENTAVDNGVTTYAINKAALKWACIFSSYSACIGVSLGAGAAGSMVSGPFGAATGFAGGAACRYVFQTAVEKYGGKDAACKILS